MSRFAISKTKAFLQSNFPPAINAPTQAILQPIRIRSEVYSSNPASFLRNVRSQHRWFSAAAGKVASKSRLANRSLHDRSSLPVSKIGKDIVRRGAAPFSSTLRPNLTGGALPRSAGGYSLGTGRGVRHFSHSPSVQAHVVQNVSAGIRAFLVNGGKARFDGIDGKTGEKRFKSISKTENELYQQLHKPLGLPAKGTNLEFHLGPTITALSSATSPSTSSLLEMQSINATGLLENLSIDFARALKDLSAIQNDLHRLSALGDLPLNLTHNAAGPVLTLRFPGCDAASVSKLCDEVNVCRGIIREDEAWSHDRDVEMALLFPLAPGGSDIAYQSHEEENGYFEKQTSPIMTASPAHDAMSESDKLDWRQMMSSSHGPSVRSSDININNDDDDETDIINLHHSEIANSSKMTTTTTTTTSPKWSESLFLFSDHDDSGSMSYPEEAAAAAPATRNSEEYKGVEGIYRFLQECENARG